MDTGTGDPFATQISTFGVQLSDTPDFSNILRATFVPDPTVSAVPIVQMIFAYMLTNLPKGVTVYARVYPVTSLGSGASLQSSGSFAIDVPSAPAVSSVSSGLSLSPYLHISWISPVDLGRGPGVAGALLSYSIEISLTQNFSPILLAQSAAAPANSSMIQSPLISEGGFYFVRITAQNSVGWSVPSNVVQKQVIIPPSAPNGAELVVSGALSFLLTWQMPSDLGAGVGMSYNISGFRVRFFQSLWSANLMPSYDYIYLSPSVFSTQLTSFKDKPLIAGQSYSADISALNDAEIGIGTASQPVQLTAVDISQPPASITLCAYNSWTYANAGSCVSSEPLSLLLTWSRPNDSGGGPSQNIKILYFELSITEGVTVMTKVNVTVPASSNSFTYKFTGMSRDVSYFATVRALTYVGAGISANSEQQYAVDVPAAPILKSIQSKTAHGSQYLVFSWQIPQDKGSNSFGVNDVPLILSYNVAVYSSSNDDTFFETTVMFSTPLKQGTILQQASSVSYTTLRSVTKGTTYSGRVLATNAVGDGPFSQSLDVTVTGYPGKPQSVTLIASSPQTLTLLWVAPTDLGAGPNVQYTRVAYEYILWSWPSGSVMQSFPELAAWTRMTGGWNQSSLILSNLTKGNMYRASVRAVNLDMADQSIDLKGTGGGPRQDDSTAGVIVLQLPQVPNDFRLQDSGEKTLIATWTAPSDTGSGSVSINALSEFGYEINLNISYLDYDTRVSRSNVTLSVEAVGSRVLSTGDFVSARIRAINPIGSSAWSLFSTAQVLNLPDPPTQMSTTFLAELNGLVSATLSFISSNETGLGPQSTIDLLTSFQLKSECISCAISICQPTRFTSILPSQSEKITVTNLAKVFIVLCHYSRRLTFILYARAAPLHSVFEQRTQQGLGNGVLQHNFGHLACHIPHKI